MTPVFADTFFWIALTASADPDHQRASEFDFDLVTTDEVLTEYLNFFSKSQNYLRNVAVQNVQGLLNDPLILVIAQTRDSFLAGVKLYAACADKGYSLTDCISMETMQREGLSDVLTNDRHSEQEGFRCLFRAS